MEFVETMVFSEERSTYFDSDEEFRRFQNYLQAAPDRGEVIPRCSGLRKVRWNDPRRGKGKRGGLRILYVYLPDINTIALMDIYDKDESEDLTAEDKRLLSSSAERIRENLRRRYGAME